jgi:hypothetical protein
VEAVLAVLDRVMMALNAGDEPALLATLQFPHYRLAGGGIRVWDRPGYRADNSVIGSYPYCGSSPNLVDAGPWRAVELRGLAANHRTRILTGQTNYPKGRTQMDYSGKTAIVTDAPSGN